jgi:hypothetical protein
MNVEREVYDFLLILFSALVGNQWKRWYDSNLHYLGNRYIILIIYLHS